MGMHHIHLGSHICIKYILNAFICEWTKQRQRQGKTLAAGYNVALSHPKLEQIGQGAINPNSHPNGRMGIWMSSLIIGHPSLHSMYPMRVSCVSEFASEIVYMEPYPYSRSLLLRFVIHFVS